MISESTQLYIFTGKVRSESAAPGGLKCGVGTLKLPPPLPVGGAGRARVEEEWLVRFFFLGRSSKALRVEIQALVRVARGARAGFRLGRPPWPGASSPRSRPGKFGNDSFVYGLQRTFSATEQGYSMGLDLPPVCTPAAADLRKSSVC